MRGTVLGWISYAVQFDSAISGAGNLIYARVRPFAEFHLQLCPGDDYFFHWCQKQGYSQLTMPQYKGVETFKEPYTDEELLLLLKKPNANCRFSECRTWVVINFCLNAGCRAATTRHILNKDVDFSQNQVFFRHTKSGKIQVIPLCTKMALILREYMAIRGGADDEYLFCDECGGQLSEIKRHGSASLVT